MAKILGNGLRKAVAVESIDKPDTNDAVRASQEQLFGVRLTSTCNGV